jgi:hypothetical protein
MLTHGTERIVTVTESEGAWLAWACSTPLLLARSLHLAIRLVARQVPNSRRCGEQEDHARHGGCGLADYQAPCSTICGTVCRTVCRTPCRTACVDRWLPHTFD